MNNLTFCVSYGINSKDDLAFRIGEKIHDLLTGNVDYIDSHILLDCHESTCTTVYVWPMECKNPVPEFLRSNAEWMIFCEYIRRQIEVTGHEQS